MHLTTKQLKARSKRATNELKLFHSNIRKNQVEYQNKHDQNFFELQDILANDPGADKARQQAISDMKEHYDSRYIELERPNFIPHLQ